ncbi:hypothetical protein IDH13_03915, partial [Pelagibacterales bacterium SAG-MED34]|nr:hypothetical protein [Pelagibacterales bacterium SAG-MED34]
NKNKFKKYRSLINHSDFKNNKLSELASFATGKLDQANLTIGGLEIEFEREKLAKKKSILNFLIISYKMGLDYLKYFSKSALKNKVYLEYKVANVHAGLHVLSEALRSDYKSYGSIFHCRLGILTALYKLHSSAKEYEQIDLPKKSNSYVCGPEQEYIYGFFSRFMSDQGALFLETNNRQQPYIKRELNEKYYSRLSLSKLETDFLEVDKDKITDYYKNRIDRPWEVFNYKVEKYSSNNELTNLNGVTVILYLHSFTDAQYVYGYDGYHDLMDWCLRTIYLLNSNEHISKVVVKPHPESTSAYHPGDSIANNYLKSKLSKYDKVEWADFHFDVNHIVSEGLVVGITHHGSVAEELVFKKIPVIASTNSYWGEEYKFGYWWKNVKDYETLISGKAITELVVTKTQIDELYRYAMDQYFNINSDVKFNVDSTWLDMLRIYDGVEDRLEHGENMEQVNQLVSKIDPDDRQFKEYIETRLKRINLLKDNSKNIIVKA